MFYPLMYDWLTEIRRWPGLVRDIDHTPTLKAVVLPVKVPEQLAAAAGAYTG